MCRRSANRHTHTDNTHTQLWSSGSFTQNELILKESVSCLSPGDGQPDCSRASLMSWLTVHMMWHFEAWTFSSTAQNQTADSTNTCCTRLWVWFPLSYETKVHNRSFNIIRLNKWADKLCWGQSQEEERKLREQLGYIGTSLLAVSSWATVVFIELCEL